MYATHFNQYAGLVPTDRLENLKFRLWLLQRCRAVPGYRDAVRELCRRDPVFFVNALLWQYNPKKRGSERGPFIFWAFQIEAFHTLLGCIERGRDCVIEKSREMGASWICLIVFDWLWMFFRDQKFLIMSRNEEAVESDSSDSLFWKLDFVHRHLPKWLTGPITRRKMYFSSDTTESSITGEASTGKAGVGGRATAMFIDEFSQIREDFEVLNRTSDTTDCRIFNGTHKGVGSAFHDICHPKSAAGTFCKKLVMHWSQHPDKNKGMYRFDKDARTPDKIVRYDPEYQYPPDYYFVADGSPGGGPFPGLRSPWYDDACRRKSGPRAVAEDLDIDPAGSESQFFDPLMIRELVHEYATPPYWEGDIIADADTGKSLGLVPQENGPLKLWCHLRMTRDGLKPEPMRCVAGTDLSAGQGATNSCLSIVNARTGEKVGEYVTPHLRPDLFAAKVVALCWLFVDGEGVDTFLSWERAGPGTSFGHKVLEYGYRNIFYRRNENDIAAVISTEPGWYPSPDNKRVLLDEYNAALATRRFKNRSEAALLECLAFKHTGRTVEHGGESLDNDPSGARSNHGDRVIADALAWKMKEELGMVYVRGHTPEPISPNSLAGRRREWEDRMRERAET